MLFNGFAVPSKKRNDPVWEYRERSPESHLEYMENYLHEYGAIIQAWENGKGLNSVGEWNIKVQKWKEIDRVHRGAALTHNATISEDGVPPVNPLRMTSGAKQDEPKHALVAADANEAKALEEGLNDAWGHVVEAENKVLEALDTYCRQLDAARIFIRACGSCPYKGSFYGIICQVIACYCLTEAIKPIEMDASFIENLLSEVARLNALEETGQMIKDRLEIIITEHLLQISKDTSQLSSTHFILLLSTLWELLRNLLICVQPVIQTQKTANDITFQPDVEPKLVFGDQVVRNFILHDEKIRNKISFAIVGSRRRHILGNECHLLLGQDMLLQLGEGKSFVYEAVCTNQDARFYAQLLDLVKSCSAQNRGLKAIEAPDIQLAEHAGGSNNGYREILLFGSSCRYSYENKKFLGAGSFGTVYGATLTDSDNLSENARNIAVKAVRLRHDILEDPVKWRKFCRGLSTLLELKHPHLVKYHQVTASSVAHIEIMMDYCDSDLSKYLVTAKNQLQYDTTICFVGQIAAGLTYLHYNSIIHGDLKPGNILVRHTQEECRLFIGDLDDSVVMQRMMTSSDDVDEIRGTLPYMAPEILNKFIAQSEDDNIVPGRKSDVWSFGCIALDLANFYSGIDKSNPKIQKIRNRATGVKAPVYKVDCR
ncbi:uncharacterized protein LOC129602029 isoform X2 [Paramacrobiotus metropolitanus]|uniref:uncharacterized protein LOC129602029 isoform X2 n=1 Tax=Paramacrobiotus metropolitanus TaxID=2943436 RepID=UPI00244561AD|nr:uncharacterized protein LOC129602029 isoform X2 [Paramacrobiotus metropolitanus]